MFLLSQLFNIFNHLGAVLYADILVWEWESDNIPMFVSRFVFLDFRESESHGNHITLQGGNLIPTPTGGFLIPGHLIPTVGPTSLKKIIFSSCSSFVRSSLIL